MTGPVERDVIKLDYKLSSDGFNPKELFCLGGSISQQRAGVLVWHLWFTKINWNIKQKLNGFTDVIPVALVAETAIMCICVCGGGIPEF